MKKSNVLLTSTLICMGALLNACDNEDSIPVENSHKLSITTSGVKSSVDTFTDGDKIGLFVKTENDINSGDYDGVNGQVSAIKSGTQWNISPDVMVWDNAYVFGYFPYSETITDPKTIPVDVNTQTDYLFAGKDNVASEKNPQVNMLMQHAMCRFKLNMIKDGYKGVGLITAMKLRGENKIATKGTMNALNGDISVTAYGTAESSFSKTVSESGWGDNLPELIAAPFSVSSKEVFLIVNIDGTDCSVELPEGNYQRGKSYTLNIKLKLLKELVAMKSSIDVDSWDNDVKITVPDVEKSARAVTMKLKTTTKGQTIVFPIIGNTFTADFGDDSLPLFYEDAGSLSHSFGNEGEYVTRLSTSEKTGVLKFPDIIACREINLSNF